MRHSHSAGEHALVPEEDARVLPCGSTLQKRRGAGRRVPRAGRGRLLVCVRYLRQIPGPGIVLVSGGRYKREGGVEGVLVLVIGACLATAVAAAAWLVHARSPGTLPVGGAAVPAAVARRTASFRLAGVIAGLAAGGAVA